MKETVWGADGVLGTCAVFGQTAVFSVGTAERRTGFTGRILPKPSPGFSKSRITHPFPASEIISVNFRRSLKKTSAISPCSSYILSANRSKYAGCSVNIVSRFKSMPKRFAAHSAYCESAPSKNTGANCPYEIFFCSRICSMIRRSCPRYGFS